MVHEAIREGTRGGGDFSKARSIHDRRGVLAGKGFAGETKRLDKS